MIARNPTERRDLNQLIRADLQANGTVAPDSKAIAVCTEQSISNRKSASKYTPGDIIQSKQGSPNLQGIPKDSSAVVVSTDTTRHNELTVRTSYGDEVIYSPHQTRTMTAQSKVYREELQEFAPGDRILVTEATNGKGFRKGDFGSITAVNDVIELRRDKGPTVQLTLNEARHIKHGYAVEGTKAGAPERILVSQDSALQPSSELARLSRTGREVSLYVSDGAVQTNSPAPSIAVSEQLKPAIALPEPKQSE